jgi:aryl-alcohol dehydrogenase-like predicted oxidoreductase
MQQNTKLGLGGHSFIRELGNDPEASFEEQCVIVGACLDNGIRWIDTTYYQERVALGNVLQALPGRRTEARITAWNFFRQPGKEDQLVGFTQYDPDSLSNQLAELQTEYLDLLVIHSRDDKDTLYKEIELATAWRDAGRFGKSASAWRSSEIWMLSRRATLSRTSSRRTTPSTRELRKHSGNRRHAVCRP